MQSEYVICAEEHFGSDLSSTMPCQIFNVRKSSVVTSKATRVRSPATACDKIKHSTCCDIVTRPLTQQGIESLRLFIFSAERRFL